MKLVLTRNLSILFTAILLLLALPVGVSFAQDLIAAIRQHKDATLLKALILKNKDKINEGDANGRTALHWAIQENDAAAFDLLLAVDGIDLNQENKWQNSPLLLSLSLGGERKEMARKLLSIKDKKGEMAVDLTQKNKWGSTPLIWAAKQGYEDLMEVMLKNKNLDAKEVNHQNQWKSNALIWSVRKGKEEQVVQLLEKGAGPELKHESGKSAADFARETNQSEVSQLIQEVTEAYGTCTNVEEVRSDPEKLTQLIGTVLEKIKSSPAKSPTAKEPVASEKQIEFDPMNASCFVAGWPGKLEAKTCQLLPEVQVLWEKTLKEQCQQGETPCGPALFGPGLCLGKKELEGGKDSNGLCLEKASVGTPRHPQIASFLLQKKNEHFNHLAELSFQALQVIQMKKGPESDNDSEDPHMKLLEWSFEVNDHMAALLGEKKSEAPVDDLEKNMDDIAAKLGGKKEKSEKDTDQDQDQDLDSEAMAKKKEMNDSHLPKGMSTETDDAFRALWTPAKIADILTSAKIEENLEVLFPYLMDPKIKDEANKQKILCAVKQVFEGNFDKYAVDFLTLITQAPPDAGNLDKCP